VSDTEYKLEINFLFCGKTSSDWGGIRGLQLKFQENTNQNSLA